MLVPHHEIDEARLDSKHRYRMIFIRIFCSY